MDLLNYLLPLTNWYLSLETLKPVQDILAFLVVGIFGVCMGSFINVAIYRSQGNYTVNYPKRSFCPNCKTTLSWRENIPLLSYSLQYGRCKHCKQQISLQYPLVELGCGIIAMILWKHSPSVLIFNISLIFAAAAGTAAVIDFKTLRLPDTLTLGGVIAILTICLPFSQTLANQTTGALIGFLMTASLYAFGKAVFGYKTTKLQSIPTVWDSYSQEPWLQLAEENESLEDAEKMSKKDLFDKPDHTISLEGKFTYTENDQTYACQRVILTPTQTLIPEENKVLTQTRVEGSTKKIVHPITPMGWGDVKLMALCGSALGPWGAVQTLIWGAVMGLVYIIILRLHAQICKNKPPEMIAFGPWLTLAAIGFLLMRNC